VGPRRARPLFDAYAAALPNRAKLRGKAGPPSPRHVQNELAHARAALEAMKVMDAPIEQIGPAELRALLALDVARPATRSARFGALGRFLDWAHGEDAISVNPMVAIPRKDRPRPPASRSRVVKLADLGRLWRAADQLSPMQRDLVRLLVALPCRTGEATSLEWQHLDFAGAAWNQPSTKTKNGEPHTLHLHPLALALLERRHAEAQRPKTGLVFPGERSGTRFQGFTRLKERLSAFAGVRDWSWHDFRRSFASTLGEAGEPEIVVDRVLNHVASAARPGAMGVYQRSTRQPEQAAVLREWCRRLSAAIDGRPLDDGDVVPIAPGRPR
jgi:integrase